MTLKEMELSDRYFVNAKDIADIVECAAENIRSQAKADQSKLGFPVVVIGSRVKIPRIPFIKYIKGE